MPRLEDLIREIHRRSLWQVLGIYVVGGWLVLQVVDTLAGALNLPDWAPRFALFLLIIGLPVVLATAFVQEGVGRRAADDGEIETTSGGTPVPRDDSADSAGQRWLTWRNAILSGVFAFALLFGFAGLYVIVQDRGQAFTPEEAVAEEADPGIAFLPFTVSGEGLDHLGEGMVHLLFASLDGAAGLRAISDRTVLAQWDRIVGTGQRADLDAAMSVADATGARYALLGSVVAIGPRLQVSGDIYEIPDGASLGRVQAEGSVDSLQAIVEDLAVATLRALAEAGVETVPRADLRGVTTHSLPALTAYLEGEAYFRRGDFEAAIPRFEAALEADSAFALANYRIGYSLGWSRGTSSAYMNHLTAAIDGNVTPRTRLMARGAKQVSGYIEDLEELVRRHPDDAEAWWVLGDYRTHVSSWDTDDPIRLAGIAFERAAELDPGFAPYVIHLIEFAVNAADTADAARWVEHYERASPGSALGRTYQIAYRLLFEPATDTMRFQAAIDTLARLGNSRRLGLLLGDPRRSRIGADTELLRADETGDLDWDACWHYALAEGHWRDFVEYASDARMSQGGRLVCLIQASWRGYPVAEEALEEEVRRWLREPNLDAPGAFEVVAYAASKGWWDEYERLLTAMRDVPRHDLVVPILEGYRYWLAGDLEMARATLDRTVNSPTARWWLGQINLELGRPEVAVRYFSSFFRMGDPWTRSLYYMGVAYEEMGELEKAQEAYAEYLDIWKDADPELEPLKEQAVLRLEAILAERG